MRALFAVTVFAIGVAGLGGAHAADYVSGGAVYGGAYAARAPQLLVYDNEPGVYVRSYWSPPWQGRHYYPFTGKKPKVGRHERLNAVRVAPTPAEPFYREWSTLSLYPPEPVIVQEPAEQPLPPLK